MSKQMKTMDQLRDSQLLYDKELPAFGYMIILMIAILLISIIIWSIKAPKDCRQRQILVNSCVC